MSQFSVITAAIEDMAGRMDGIAPGVLEFHGQIGTHADAASQTPVDGAMSGLMTRWAAVLPHFGLAGDRLSGAMRGAAGTYQRSDAAVGQASGGSARR